MVAYNFADSTCHAVLSHLPPQSLDRLVASYSDTENSFAMSSISPLLSSPTLRRFEGHMLHCREDALLAQASTVREMTLGYSVINAVGLQSIFENCPSLRELDIEFGDASVDYECDINYTRLGEVLTTQKHNLDRFSLDDAQAEGGVETEGHLGSLKDLTLKTLILPAVAIFADEDEHTRARWLAEKLPTTLITLELKWGEAHVQDYQLDQVRSLMVDPRFEKLEKVTLCCPMTLDVNSDWPGWKLECRKGTMIAVRVADGVES
ncbi:hypothetical protein BDZ85DRAFT_105474 [Elsinoe ampelina]|uniref:F-box domain-containing protein n=1 Tax=Elsinoe ampelina TaxID=302913 RepID=A0A6A6FXZ5_9PEZI|nr:hypothetical protein BDZ85DRAFT_105474 [Elsinoe ampelina]